MAFNPTAIEIKKIQRRASEIRLVNKRFQQLDTELLDRRLRRNSRRRLYIDWMVAHSHNYKRGAAPRAVSDMACEFPELKICRGIYRCTMIGEQNHIWLADAFDNVLDPVAWHFPSKGAGEYELRSETKPSGVCAECGTPCSRGEISCSSACYTLFLERLMGR